MARGTSPQPRRASSIAWTAVAGMVIESTQAWLRWARVGRGRRLQGPQIAATLYLAGMAFVSLTAWQAPAAGLSDVASSIGALHLLLLLGIGSVMALTTLARSERLRLEACATPTRDAPGDGLGELMAHMSHALRTPLNAVIGFSEVMARELHGPLGNRRYQEYAHHICESGGRLLKSSEDALAVTEAMTALMTDRTRGRRERVLLSVLLREASEGLEAAAGLRLIGCEGFAITCERRATAQALQHLLRHAQALPGADRFEIMARPDPAGGLELRAPGAGGTDKVPDKGSGGAPLHIILARLLLQTQGASLECSNGDGGWSALVRFAAQG
jgi:signal transduction histidine kinase